MLVTKLEMISGLKKAWSDNPSDTLLAQACDLFLINVHLPRDNKISEINEAIAEQQDHLTVEEWEAKVEASRQVVQLSGVEVNVELFQSDVLLINGIEVSRTDLNILLELME